MTERALSSVLALDLGTKTGFCVGTACANISGVWNLKPDRFSGGGMRFVRFRGRLEEIRGAYPLHMVVFEEVRRHAATDAAHVYGGLMGLLTEWCENHNIPYEGVPVGTIKKFWTGKGNADKKAMLAECARRGMSIIDDNEADATALFWLKMAEFNTVPELKPGAKYSECGKPLPSELCEDAGC